MNNAPEVPVPAPPVLTDEEFDAYCSALERGQAESVVMATFGISRKQYWRVQCAANRRRNREAWLNTKQFRESSRRFEKWSRLADKVLNRGAGLGSLRACRRHLAYDRYDRRRAGKDSPSA